MVTTAERAARNEFQQRARTASATKGAEAGFAAALEAMGGRPAKGSRFLRCALSETDARFVKYPRLPVTSCAGFSKVSASTRSIEDG